MVQFLLMIVKCDFYSACCSCHGKIIIQFPRHNIACRYNVVEFLKHVSKAHDILCVVHINSKQVVGLIYTKQLVP